VICLSLFQVLSLDRKLATFSVQCYCVPKRHSQPSLLQNLVSFADFTMSISSDSR
jgi:hypothetical protein